MPSWTALKTASRPQTILSPRERQAEMAEIVFFEKPGCVNNGKQKEILLQAGHSLCCVDMISYPWSKEKLLPFVVGKKPEEMMNSTAPAVKNGELVPAALAFEQAVAMMVAEPLLIKRPLVVVDNLFIQGFDDERLRPYLGKWDGGEDVATCPFMASTSCDERQKKEMKS